MTREEFRKYIRENIVILDGATGTNLMAAGMPVGVCPEEWVMEHPQVILDLQKAYVDNGTNIVQRRRLRMHEAAGIRPPQVLAPLVVVVGGGVRICVALICCIIRMLWAAWQKLGLAM